jgi:hypothetical protein
MASPQESITTVNGRRCTRSRARTAAQSTSTPAATPTAAPPKETTTSTTAQEASSAQQTAASPPASQQLQPPPPPPPPSSSPPVESSAVVSLPAPQTTSSTAGTDSVLVSLATTPLPAVAQPSASAPENPTPSAPSQPSDPINPSSQVAAAPSNPPVRLAPTSSDTSTTAAIVSSLPPPQSSSTTPAVAQPVVTQSTDITKPTSVAAVPDIAQSDLSSQLLSTATSVGDLLSQTKSAVTSIPTRDALGIIAPEQGSHSSGGEHGGEGHSSSHSDSGANIGGIVGGAVGGVVGLALLGLLLFFCLRRRKARGESWDEKNEERSGFASKLKAVPAGLFARLRNEKTGPLNNPYQRHQPRSSVGSVYSTTSSGQRRSMSDPQGQAAAGGGFVRRMSSKKSERNVLRKKTSSVSSQASFLGITEEPARGNNNIGYDRTAGFSPEPPRNLRISNPDTLQQPTPGPSPPQPTATPRVVRDPFASLIDEIDGAPDWLRDSNMTAASASNHRRTQSSVSVLPSHPPSSVYSMDPFADPSPIPPMPTQMPTSQQPKPSVNTYSAFPVTRDSAFTFFGEPGPSRPGTTVFGPGLPSNPGASRSAANVFDTRAITPGPLTGGPPTSTSRLDRQSDPFDLDRPEVLSFKGIMNQMRDSIARTATVRSRRTSSVGNWFGREASPAPALNGPSVRR